VLLLTRDESLWQRWRDVSAHRLVPARGSSLQDLVRWQDQGRELVLIDDALSDLPSWEDPQWHAYARNMKIVVASSSPSDEAAAQALAEHCCGYLHAYSPIDVLSRALLTVQSGGLWIGRTLVARIVQE